MSLARLPIPPHRQGKTLKAVTGFEPVIEVLQTSALPLGYTAILKKMERKTGFEPATPTLARWCSTTELLPQSGWATRIRTWGMTGPKPVALPLGYSPTNNYFIKKWGDRWGSNPRMPEPQSGALTTSPRPPSFNNINGRGSRNRTHIKGFGDLRFTIKLYPYLIKYYTTKNGGGGQIRTAEP